MKKSVRIIILVLILSALAVGYYYYLSSKSTENSYNSEDTEVTEVFKVINRDLEKDYPETPREVISFYVRIQQCMYNEDYTEEEFVDIISQARLLMDEELLAENPYNDYYKNARKDVDERKSEKSKLSSYIIAKNSEVLYTTFQEQRYANVSCIYYFKNSEGTLGSSQEYILRKDEQGNWKILASNLITQDE